jgi:hypothetical protein
MDTQRFTDFVIKPGNGNRPSSGKTDHSTVVIPYLKGISEKFRSIGNSFKVMIIFNTKHTFGGALMKAAPVRDAQQMKECMYSISCECDRCCIGETRRSLVLRTEDHRHNLTQGLLEKSKYIHAYKGGHQMCWKEVLQSENPEEERDQDKYEYNRLGKIPSTKRN